MPVPLRVATVNQFYHLVHLFTGRDFSLDFLTIFREKDALGSEGREVPGRIAQLSAEIVHPTDQNISFQLVHVLVCQLGCHLPRLWNLLQSAVFYQKVRGLDVKVSGQLDHRPLTSRDTQLTDDDT
jgi:hypothetical protein